MSFSLVDIHVAMYTATQDNDISFNQLHKDNGSRIKYKKVCAHYGKKVGAEDIVKGYRYDKDHYIIVTDEEIERIKAEKEKSIQILHFAQLDQISPIYYDKCYHMVPEAGGAAESPHGGAEARHRQDRDGQPRDPEGHHPPRGRRARPRLPGRYDGPEK